MTSEPFMAPFPVLLSLCSERWRLWQKALEREVDGDVLRQQSYLPLWLKMNWSKQNLPEFWVDLAEWEWSVFFVKNCESMESTPFKESRMGLNPICRVVKLNFDLNQWFSKELWGEPIRRSHILFISPLAIREASLNELAVLKTLEEQPMHRTELIELMLDVSKEEDWEEIIEKLRCDQILLG